MGAVVPPNTFGVVCDVPLQLNFSAPFSIFACARVPTALPVGKNRFTPVFVEGPKKEHAGQRFYL